MKIPLSWLKDFVNLTLSPAALAERLTLAGMEVESINQVGELWDRDKVYVGQILDVKRHPEADRLTLVRVEYGGETPLRVVTGAPNLYPYIDQDFSGGRGPKVAFALAGARLVDGHSEERRVVKLKPNKIRGIMSEGMVCSEKELDLSEEHEGNLILHDDRWPLTALFVTIGGHRMVMTGLLETFQAIPLGTGGGVSDGHGMLAVLALGAEGVIIGTRILATKEAPIHDNLKQALVQASELDTMLIMRSLHATHRVWTNAAAQKCAELEAKSADPARVPNASSLLHSRLPVA